MKPIITGYLDHDGTMGFEYSVQKALKSGIDSLALRAYDGKPLIELSDGELKKILLDAKGDHIKFSIMDSNIKPYDPYDDKKHANAVDEYKYMLKVAERLKINHLFLKLPIINNIIEEYETIEKRLGDYVEASARAGKKIVLLPEKGYKANTYVYILKKMKSKHVGIAYDPVIVMQNNESATTTYRLLRSYIMVMFAHDETLQGEPELMGFGKSDVLKVLKKLERDHFSGFIMVDHHFNPAMFKDEPVKKGFFKQLFSNDKKKKSKRLSELSRRIFPDEETKNVTEDDILENQIKLIQTIFK